MSAGRGQFFRSFQRGLERGPAATGHRPRRGGAQSPGTPATGHPVGPPRQARRASGWPPAAAGGGRPGNGPRPTATRKPGESRPRRRTQTCPEGSCLESLPTEILMKILSYLDAASLFCVGHVSRRFHRLAKDDVIWFEIYMSAFGSRMWKPDRKEQVEVLEEEEEEEETSGHWKRMYFRTVAGQHLIRWRKELKVLDPFTGLPQHTRRILRGLGVVWELRLRDRFGRDSSHLRGGAYSESSMILCWSGFGLPEYDHISSMELHAVRREAEPRSQAGPSGWSSLMLQVNMKHPSSKVFIRGRLVRLHRKQHGFLIGVWQGQNKLAFIMVSLHYHRLVERALLGSPACPYLAPPTPPLRDASDPQLGLRGYTLHLVLRNISSEIMAGLFPRLSARPGDIVGGLMLLRVINKSDPSKHRALSGKIRLPWKSEAQDGAVENCCFMALTLLDELQKPLWCESAPLCLESARDRRPSLYGGEHFLLRHRGADGRLKMTLVWLKEQEQFFLIGLSVAVAVVKVNQRFGTAH